MIFHYDSFEFMFLIHNDMDRNRFLEAAGTPTGPSKELFGRIYDALRSENIDVIEEYETFYNLEYQNLGSYLYRKWNMSYDTVESICKCISENPELRLFRRVARSYQGSGLRNFISEEPMLERIEKILIMN
jgi:hypothetical protein